MIDFTKNKKEFEEYKFRYSELFNTDKKIEENPFNNNFKYFMGFEFDLIFHKVFFESLKLFLNKLNNHNLIFYTIDPSPENYFYKYFEKYNVINIKINNTDEELNEIMMKDPLDSSADALAVNSNEISWFSSSDDWAILGCRDWEIAIAGFTSLEMKEKFITSFGESTDMFTSVKKQADILDEMLKFTDDERKEYAKLVENYKDRI